jgi:hypothetical protein
MQGVKFVPVSAESGLLTYKVTENGTPWKRICGAGLHLSCRDKHGGNWICLFSQETATK